MSVRLPRIPSVVDSVDTKFAWLPKIAPYLPFPVPTPIAMGKPTPPTAISYVASLRHTDFVSHGV